MSVPGRPFRAPGTTSPVPVAARHPSGRSGRWERSYKKGDDNRGGGCDPVPGNHCKHG